MGSAAGQYLLVTGSPVLLSKRSIAYFLKEHFWLWAAMRRCPRRGLSRRTSFSESLCKNSFACTPQAASDTSPLTPERNTVSTNHYARWKPTAAPLEWRLHLGTSRGGGLATISGLYFPTVAAWSTFLLHNAASLTLEDEYGQYYPGSVEDFVAKMLLGQPEDSRPDREALGGMPVASAPPKTVAYAGDGSYWLDGGRLFYNGEFS
jgi:hypothetical protein